MATACPRRRLPVAARFVVVLVVLAALFAPRVLQPAARAQSASMRHTQDIWLVAGVALTDADGNTSDATPEVNAAVSAQLDQPVTLSSGLDYQKSESITGRVAAADGSTLPSIRVQVGLLTERRADGSTASIV